jgi:succinyl-CoA synthetase beta subunit
MKLHEYQSKQIFSRYGIPIPKGRVATTPGEARHIADELGGRVVIKAQVLVGGRGKAGGVRLARDANEAEQFATQILAMEIKGLPVRKVLIDEAASIDQEIYLGITNDRAARVPVIIASAAGGVEIEEVAKTDPEKIIRVHINPLLGIKDYQARDIATGIDLPREYWKPFNEILKALWECYNDNDATLAEINPLIISKDKRLIALDGKMLIDDNALFRHPDLSEMRDTDEDAPSEVEARKYGLTFIKLDGNIGCMVNGAGLAMASMDILKYFGGEPANFPGYRRRRGRGESHRRPAHHPGRPKCQSGFAQYLWRHHPLRRSGARHLDRHRRNQDHDTDGCAAGRHQCRRRPPHAGRCQPDHRRNPGRRRAKSRRGREGRLTHEHPDQ